MSWYDQSEADVLKELGANPKRGLSSREADVRLRRDGPNALPKGKELAWWQLLFRQFKSPLVYILVVAAVVTAWLNEWTDTIVISLAVLINTGIGFWQDYHAGNVFKALERAVRVRARVVRDGKLKEIDSQEVVLGDIIVVSTGMRIPADARLLKARDLDVNEALLTGESSAVRKGVYELTHDEVPLAERSNMMFMGTTVDRGEGRAVVVKTGAKTEVGRIAELTATAGEGDLTPLQERLAKLGRVLTVIIGVSAVVIFVAGALAGRELVESFKVAVAVAVAGIPEGLPAALSVVLAVSMQRILKRKGLVKQLIAAETLGSTSVICADKTGTLTEGVMKLEELLMAPDKGMSLKALALANEAIVERDKEGKLVIRGESTDRAKLKAFFAADGDLDQVLKKEPRVATIPFTSEKKYLASFHERDGKQIVYVSGAPEVLLERSYGLSRDAVKEAQSQYEDHARRGFRMIASGWRELPKVVLNIGDISADELDQYVQGLTFGGLAAIRDPIRSDVADSLKITREAGVQVVMITGDHVLTAKAIAEELGFAVGSEAVMEGKELNAISDEELTKRITKLEVFARVNPEHKMRIIDAWQARGHAVAMTGDGVNDAPALKAADIGIAVDSGTDVTKEAADLVLMDDSFTTITEAIKQGRIAFDNIRKVTIFLLTGSFSELVLVLASIVLGLPLPFTAAQILWINLVEDGPPNFALAFEPGEKGIMKRKPLPREAQILDAQGRAIFYGVGPLSDILMLGIFFWLYQNSGWTLEHIQTFMFTAVGTNALFNVFAIKSLKQPLWRTSFLNNHYLLGAIVISFTMIAASIYAPPIQRLLNSVALPMNQIGIIVLLGLVQMTMIEVVKAYFRARERRQAVVAA